MAGGDDRQRVLDATDIVRVVGEHAALKAKGREHVCLCPFHDDHNPSMYVVPHKQIFHCFVCGAGGNAIDFVMRYHRMDFREALGHLADRAGITLTPFKKGGEASAASSGPSKRDLAEANRIAADFFRRILEREDLGAAAREAIAARGFTDETAEAFELGAAPDMWDGLAKTVEKRGLGLDAFEAAGLVKRRETGGRYDALRNRWVFPIHDQLGRVVGFGGRKLRAEDEPKYLNSPESALFDKSSTLYGLRQGLDALRQSRRAVVVEGYTDVLACHQAGERNAVATLGTALTQRHAKILRRFCDEVVLVFDGDEAGARAADRAVEVFLAEPVDVKIAVLPGGKDPADLVSDEEGLAAWRAAIGSARDALGYRFARFGERLAGKGPAARARLVEEELVRLNEIGLGRLNPIRRRQVVRMLARAAGVDEQSVAQAMASASPRRARASEGDGPAAPGAPRSAREHLIGCLLARPALIEELEASDAPILRGDAVAEAGEDRPGLAALGEALAGLPEAGAVERLAATVEDADARSAAAALSSHVETVTDGDGDRLVSHFRACLGSLRRLRSELGSSAPAQGGNIDGERDFAAVVNAIASNGPDPTALPRPGLAAE